MSRPIGHQLSETERDEIRQALARGGSIRSVARRLGHAFGTVQRYAREAAAQSAQGPPTIAVDKAAILRVLYEMGLVGDAALSVLEPTPQPDPIEVEKGRIERERKLRSERDAIKEIAGERSLREHLTRLIEDAAERFPAPPPPAPAKEQPGATTEGLLLFLSDWHAYEIVKSSRVLGLNRFDADVLGRRAWKVTDAALGITSRLERGGWRFPALTVALGGDFVSGTVHEVEKHTDAPSIVQAVWGTGLLLAHALRDLAARFPAVHCVGVPGNHGRLPDARKVPSKDPTRSWDWLVYQIARLSLRDLDWVTWQVPDAYSAEFELAGSRFYLNHGHEIRSNLSIPFYGIDRKVRNLRAVLNPAPAYYLFAHFHSPGSIRNYVVNGCLIGPTEYAVEGLGVAEPPSQWLLGVHPERGITHRWELFAGSGEEGPSYPVRPWTD
jgi:hypothetical protein